MIDKNTAQLLNQELIEASKAYYNDEEIMSNEEFDRKWDQLKEYSIKTGEHFKIIDQPGEDNTKGFSKVQHEELTLSLAKTKDPKELKKFIGENEACFSYKLDGLTCVITYDDGKLTLAATRGNGRIGDDITRNAKCFTNVPHEIPLKGHIVLRGEALMSYDTFNKVNIDSKYKNPRNLASGTLKTLDTSVFKERKIEWIVFEVVEGLESNSWNERLNTMSQWFDVVPHKLVNKDNIEETVKEFTESAKTYAYPLDGLVVELDNINYGKGLGNTEHHPRSGLAFKWADTKVESRMRSIKWTKTRTGRLNPVAVFDPVEIEGSTVSQASIHNLTWMNKLNLGINDRVTVYKANMIIPQIAENLDKTGTFTVPTKCPHCNGPVEIRNNGGADFLYCKNNCSSLIERLNYFFSDVKGLGGKTLEKMEEAGLLSKFIDIFNINEEVFCSIDGLGKTKYDAIQDGLKNFSITESKFLGSLGISSQNEKTFRKVLEVIPFNKIKNATINELASINGIGLKKAELIHEGLQDPEIWEIAKFVKLAKNPVSKEAKMKVTFTGKMNHQRKELTELAEEVPITKAEYLVTNTPDSGTAKNKKADELGIPKITEEEFLKLVQK